MSPTPITICPDPDTLAFECENSGAFLRHWQSLRDAGSVPRAEAIDPAALKTFLPEIIIYDLPDLSTVRYRLTGTLAAKRLGFEPKGMNLAEFATAKTRPLVTLGFNLVARSHVGLVAHYTVVLGGEQPARVESLLLPLMPPDGEAPRVIALVSCEKLSPAKTRFGIDKPVEAIGDACFFDLGFGLPDLSMIPGLSVATSNVAAA